MCSTARSRVGRFSCHDLTFSRRCVADSAEDGAVCREMALSRARRTSGACGRRILHTQASHPRARSSPRKPGDAHHHGCTCCKAYSRVIHAQSVPAWAPVISRTGGAALQVRGGTEGKGGGIEGADARQSASRSTAPRRTHAQTTWYLTGQATDTIWTAPELMFTIS